MSRREWHPRIDFACISGGLLVILWGASMLSTTERPQIIVVVALIAAGLSLMLAGAAGLRARARSRAREHSGWSALGTTAHRHRSPLPPARAQGGRAACCPRLTRASFRIAPASSSPDSTRAERACAHEPLTAARS